MDKKVIIIVGVVVLLLLGGGGYMVLSKNSASKPAPTPVSQEEETVQDISSKDIGLKLEFRPDKKAIRFVIDNASDIQTVDYQISYTKEVNGENVPEGLIGDAKPEDGKIEIKYRELGTCSSGVCRYDKVSSPIKVTLKVTKTDGKVYKAEDSIEI
ncbi:MAG: hypothetical protein M1426_06225 [Patescibacteria group bacterium]|nr:hypothetical protein [Patescibacteria group bacterium]